MAEKNNDKNKEKEKKEPEVVSLSLATGQFKNRQLPVTAFVSLGRRELAGKTVYFYIGQDYRQAATSASGTDGRAGALIDVPVDAKGSILVSAKAEGMPTPTSITTDIPEPEEEKKTQQVKYLSIESTWQGYDQKGNAMYQWIPRLFDENNKSIAGKITISSENSIEINGKKKTKFTEGISDNKVDVYKIVISDGGTIEVDVFVHGCNIKREFQLRGKKVEKTAGDPPASNAKWWEKFKYGLKGGKL